MASSLVGGEIWAEEAEELRGRKGCVFVGVAAVVVEGEMVRRAERVRR